MRLATLIAVVALTWLQGCGPPQASARLGEELPELKELLELRKRRLCVGDGAPRELPEALQDNAPEPRRRMSDLEIKSQVPQVLAGATQERQHGKLGLLSDGSCCKLHVTPLPAAGLNHTETVESHRGFCFSSRASEATDIDRIQKDVRSENCRMRHDSYPCDLPRASIIMVFHNEHFHTLLRSVHSVLNLSPADLLEELILVDDSSQPDPERFYERYWQRLQSELEDHVKTLPKVRLLRLKERRGLMRARMEGIWRARAEVAVFLDSHIEATPGWLEPLLARIAEDRTRLVVPSIDGIDTEDFGYTVFGLGLVSFNWQLNQKPRERPEGEDSMAPSSVMCGGLFAADKSWFLHLGGYDPEMKIYGGEEMEIGFSAWQCGGSVMHEPCSHVGHLWRSHRYWSNQVYRIDQADVTRNRLRVAEAWMDEYKALAHLAGPPLFDRDLGDVRPRQELRARLGCKSFDWYLDNVATEIHAPKLAPTSTGPGRFRSVNGAACVDTMFQDMLGATVGAHPCVEGRPSQEIEMDADSMVRTGMTGFCLGLKKDCAAEPQPRQESLEEAEAGVKCEETPVLVTCSEGRSQPRWRWLTPVEARKGIGRLQLEGTERCLELVNYDFLDFGIKIASCRSNFAESQLWLWETDEERSAEPQEL